MSSFLSQPAFEFVPLATLRFRTVEEGGWSGPLRSDLRVSSGTSTIPTTSRTRTCGVYFVGREAVNAGEEVPVLLAFLRPENQRTKCREGTC
jgi:hypothetical protein